MTKKEFLDVFNDIDDEFINEVVNISCDDPTSYFANEEPNTACLTDGHNSLEPRENYFFDEQPQKVYLSDKPVPFWKIAVSTAAAVCILSVGILAVAKLRGIHTMPNDSTAENSSFAQTESSEPDKFDMVLTEGIEFSCLTLNRPYSSELITKNDDENYAVVYFYGRNISEENPLFIAIKKYSNGNPVYLGTLYVTENTARTYRIDYEEEVKEGDEVFLYMSTKSDEIMRADGKWLP